MEDKLREWGRGYEVCGACIGGRGFTLVVLQDANSLLLVFLD